MVVKGRTKRNDSQKGIGLVMALMTLLLLSLLGAALLTATTVDVWIGDNYRTATQLLYLTESGIEDGREMLSHGSLQASSQPFIKDRWLVDHSGREIGHYSVALIRANPLTLKSTGTIGTARKTIEVRLLKSGFPTGGALKTPAEAERVVEGILVNATEVFTPEWDAAVPLGSVGSPSDYPVVVVQGNCEIGGSAGFGMLLVRGDLTIRDNFSWNGLILVIGQGTVRVAGPSTGWITGGLFLLRTRDSDRSAANTLGALLDQLGATTLDLSGNTISVEPSPAETDRANERFPFVPVSYREY